MKAAPYGKKVTPYTLNLACKMILYFAFQRQRLAKSPVNTSTHSDVIMTAVLNRQSHKAVTVSNSTEQDNLKCK